MNNKIGTKRYEDKHIDAVVDRLRQYEDNIKYDEPLNYCTICESIQSYILNQCDCCLFQNECCSSISDEVISSRYCVRQNPSKFQQDALIYTDLELNYLIDEMNLKLTQDQSKWRITR